MKPVFPLGLRAVVLLSIVSAGHAFAHDGFGEGSAPASSGGERRLRADPPPPWLRHLSRCGEAAELMGLSKEGFTGIDDMTTVASKLRAEVSYRASDKTFVEAARHPVLRDNLDYAAHASKLPKGEGALRELFEKSQDPQMRNSVLLELDQRPLAAYVAKTPRLGELSLEAALPLRRVSIFSDPKQAAALKATFYRLCDKDNQGPREPFEGYFAALERDYSAFAASSARRRALFEAWMNGKALSTGRPDVVAE